MSVRTKARASSVAARSTREGGHMVEMQRRRLLLAIGEVVGENGLEAATVGRVCEQAGVSRRTFYELFADRESCLLEAFDAQIESLRESMGPVFESADHRWRERIRQALTVLLERLDAEPDVARLCLIETSRAGPRLLERRREVLEKLASAIDGGRAEARSGSEPPPLTAEGVVGGVMAVMHARLLTGPPAALGGPGVAKPRSRSLVELTGPLTAMIVHPYLGAGAAQKELERPKPAARRRASRGGADPFRGLSIRFTYRTARVLATIASDPGASNRHIAECSGIADQGQISRLLRRLCNCELIENRGEGHAKGEPNAWMLTERGAAIHETITVQAAGS